MTAMQEPPDRARRPAVDAGRLWAGGLATAAVAALIAVVGILLGRGVLGIAVLGPTGAGGWGDAHTGWYALGAALCALAATALAHVLLLTTPQPMSFFTWVLVLATVVATLVPWVAGDELGARLYTAGLNLVLGIAIGSLVAGSAHLAVLRPARQRPPGPPRPLP